MPRAGRFAKKGSRAGTRDGAFSLLLYSANCERFQETIYNIYFSFSFKRELLKTRLTIMLKREI